MVIPRWQTVKQPMPVAMILNLCLTCLSTAGDLAFQRHVVNADSEYSAVAVLDVNHDGNQDILCGGFWYEAPLWKRHFVRDVERIGGRFDGYSHLPMDVNGDGWTDIITVNYRSRSIRWLQHPGAELGPWLMHTVEEPGAMETGRLTDVDGDGRLDVLSNGQDFASWWEVRPGTLGEGPQWTRNELPAEVAGHGLGFGDVNGDGRGDVVGPKGWAAAPQDRRKERWVWHPEFELGRASLPVLVVDVDEDGDNDLIWTRAHAFGVYWMEQSMTDQGSRKWTHHTIDTSWSQCHSPLWTDMDGDGRNELVAGKRYMSHEGRDPGAYDPLVSYRYQFDSESRTWQRWVISAGEQVGFGLDPKVIDLDADGDLDLVVCGRSGLYWMENLGPTSDADRPEIKTPTYLASEFLVVKDAVGGPRPIETGFDWGLRRSHIVASIERELGPLPGTKRRVPLDVRIIKQAKIGDVTRQTISYQSSEADRIQADVWLPKNDVAMAAGLVLVNQGAVGSASAAGTEDANNEDSAQQMAARGYVCVVPDLPAWNSGNRGEKILESKQAAITIEAIWNCMRAVDVLESYPQVNVERIGFLGTGNGAQLALFTAALDQRILATSLGGELAILDVDEEADRGFSFPELVAAIAPRSIAFQIPARMSVAESEKLKRGVERASPAFQFTRTAAPPTINVQSSTVESPSAHEWLDGKLTRTASRRPRTR